MRLMLLTFRKDVRRLWPAAAVTWVMLASLSRADRWRTDWLASPMEGWMTILLTMAWACLAALVVQEEPLVGDRNFWTTRPHRWPSLLVAKLLFLALAIHVPSFLADLYILSARGFSPSTYLAELLGRQILYLGTITLPAMALASLVPSFATFVVATFAIGGGILALNGGFQVVPDFYTRHEVVHTLVRITAALVAIVVLAVQYASRRALTARILAIAGAICAVIVGSGLPASAEYMGDAAGPHIALAGPASLSRPYGGVGTQPGFVVPIALDSSIRFHRARVEVEVTTPEGARFHSQQPSPYSPAQSTEFRAYLTPEPNRLNLFFSHRVWESLKGRNLHITGAVEFDTYRLGPTTTIPAYGNHAVPEVGRCTAFTESDTLNDAFKVACESPRAFVGASIVLRHEGSALQWNQELSPTVGMVTGPREAWLSPLNRGQAFFRLTDQSDPKANQWMVPADWLPALHIEITPEIPTGRTVSTFDFPIVSFVDR